MIPNGHATYLITTDEAHASPILPSSAISPVLPPQDINHTVEGWS
jgi:hypothetical protein